MLSSRMLQRIDRSGNSHVIVKVDTTPIAYALLFQFHASGQLGNQELDDLIARFEDTLQRHHYNKKQPVKSKGKGKVKVSQQEITYHYEILPAII